MRLTKNDMARVVVQALYGLPAIPAADNPNVVAMARRYSLTRLADSHKTAMAHFRRTQGAL